MTRFDRCDGCGRWKATDRQWAAWGRWCHRESRLASLLTVPIWWRLGTRCLQWHDCVPRSEDPRDFRDYGWWVRLMFGLRALVTTPETSEKGNS